ncbi:MAG: hypothetical protein JOZ90_15250 [Alphaproteobacteria bacterium]|nr:hypothetical protein [Alphaproteobacteria bacterium]MBV9372079.1 hypothetical protein [Alphaproteobacteria bacterium]MBV9902429.1 hypothetical protein [Alphaproteobacteria bacterium]
MTKRNAKLLLTYLWWGWGLLLFAPLIFFTVNEATSAFATAAWSWFLPDILPVLTLVGAAAYKDGGRDSAAAESAGPLLPATIGISAVYLLVLTLCVLLLFLRVPPVAAVQPTNLFLAPLQGAATTFLGLFFTSPRK